MEKPSKRTAIIICGAVIISAVYFILALYNVISPNVVLPIAVFVISALYLIFNRNEKLKSRLIYFIVCLPFIAMGIFASFIS